jgi:hypothetical protein
MLNGKFGRIRYFIKYNNKKHTIIGMALITVAITIANKSIRK